MDSTYYANIPKERWIISLLIEIQQVTAGDRELRTGEERSDAEGEADSGPHHERPKTTKSLRSCSGGIGRANSGGIQDRRLVCRARSPG